MIKIVNLTPHPVLVVREDDNGENVGSVGVGPATTEIRYSVVETIVPTGTVARARQIDEPAGSIEINGFDVPLVTSRYGEPTDLPEPGEGTYYCVSILTAQAAKASGRDTSDLLVTADPVRGTDGRIVGCRKFAVV